MCIKECRNLSGWCILQVPFRKGGTFLMLSCCFIGHRNIDVTNTLSNGIRAIILDFLNKGVEIFYFGSRSQFNDLCWDIVTDLKKDYPNIQRVYVRTEYQYVNRDYTDYLLQYYEDTFYPPKVDGSGKLAYVKRNQLMIDSSDYCLFYYNPNDSLPMRKSKYGLPPKAVRSGTKLAYDYALSKAKIIHNVFTGELPR